MLFKPAPANILRARIFFRGSKWQFLWCYLHHLQATVRTLKILCCEPGNAPWNGSNASGIFINLHEHHKTSTIHVGKYTSPNGSWGLSSSISSSFQHKISNRSVRNPSDRFTKWWTHFFLFSEIPLFVETPSKSLETPSKTLETPSNTAFFFRLMWFCYGYTLPLFPCMLV